MYSQLCLPHSIVIYCTLASKRFYIGSKEKGTWSWFNTGDEQVGHTGWKYHWEEQACC